MAACVGGFLGVEHGRDCDTFEYEVNNRYPRLEADSLTSSRSFNVDVPLAAKYEINSGLESEQDKVAAVRLSLPLSPSSDPLGRAGYPDTLSARRLQMTVKVRDICGGQGHLIQPGVTERAQVRRSLALDRLADSSCSIPFLTLILGDPHDLQLGMNLPRTSALSSIKHVTCLWPLAELRKSMAGQPGYGFLNIKDEDLDKDDVPLFNFTVREAGGKLVPVFRPVLNASSSSTAGPQLGPPIPITAYRILVVSYWLGSIAGVRSYFEPDIFSGRQFRRFFSQALFDQVRFVLLLHSLTRTRTHSSANSCR